MLSLVGLRVFFILLFVCVRFGLFLVLLSSFGCGGLLVFHFFIVFLRNVFVAWKRLFLEKGGSVLKGAEGESHRFRGSS